jgi:SAM-dependent methyltransferase
MDGVVTEFNAKRAAFDRMAADWDAGHGPTSGRGREFAARVRLLCRLCAGGGVRVLDLGCGTGLNLIALGDAIGSGVGVDFSPAMIACATAKAAEVGAANLSFRVGDAVTTDTGPEPFDVILLSGVLEHLPDPDAALAACRSRLARGGRIVIIAPHPHNPAFLWQRLVQRRRPVLFADDRHRTPAELTEMARRHGLERVGLHALACRPSHEGEAAPPRWVRAVMAGMAAVPLQATRGAFALVLRAA